MQLQKNEEGFVAIESWVEPASVSIKSVPSSKETSND
jgi:hypothetical protein